MQNVAFDVAAKYAIGARTAVGLNADGVVVAVEQLGTRVLMQRVGTIDVGAINFGPAAQYGSGLHPSVAISNDIVVEVHQSDGTTNNLLYHIGQIKDGALSLGSPNRYDTGTDPAVAINLAGSVVGLQNNDTALFVRVGQMSRTDTGARTLTHWGPDDKKMLTNRGVNGAIAVNNQGMVVAAYRQPGMLLTIVVGQLNGLDVNWGVPFVYGLGTLPALALTDDNFVVEAHLEKQNDETFLVFTNAGPLDPVAKTVNFPADRNNFRAPVSGFERRANTITTLAADTNNVSVAANRTLAVETFSDTNNDVGYSASLILDRANWMGANLPSFGSKVLRQLSIPGSHDAFTSRIGQCSLLGRPCAAKTQDSTLFDQLQSGVRYFDIRPAIFQNELYTGHFGDIGAAAATGLRAAVGSGNVLGVLAHFFGLLGGPITNLIATAINRDGVNRVQGCLGPTLSEVLADVKRFMQTGAKEVVILKFSHYLNMDSQSDLFDGVFRFDQAQTTRLVSAVVAALGDYLYVSPFTTPSAADPRGGRLANTPLSTLLGSRGIVLPVFDLAGSELTEQPGTYSYGDFVPSPMSPPVIRVGQGSPPLPDTIPENVAFQFNRTDLLVYDKFADKSELAAVSSDQLAKLRDVANHGGDLFVLSWTLTLTDSQSLNCDDTSGTLSVATTADNALAAAVTSEYARGGITRATIPNILFVDRASDFATDVSVWLDRRMSLGDTLFGERRDYLAPGDSLVSPNGRYRLTYQPNGDLFFYVDEGGSSGGTSVSKTAGQPAWRCIMQDDGNFVIYSAPYKPIFASETSGHDGARVVISNDGKYGLFEASGERIRSPKFGN
jgi:hypothetical protein